MSSAPHDHDLGLAHDLSLLLNRRQMIALAAGGAAAAGGLPASAANAACTALPWETAGPYPGDGSNSKNGRVVNVLTEAGILREDMRPSFGTLTGAADGVEMTLDLTLMTAQDCAPLPGAAIYAWHCDALGRYSLYDLTDANYLRGVGIADAAGRVRFTTIVPGCYDGRWPHIHFEVFADIESAVAGKASLLTAQIAFPKAPMEAVYAAHASYSNGTRNLSRLSLERDGVFADNTDAQLAQQTARMSGTPADGYKAEVDIPLDLSVTGPSRRGGFLRRVFGG